MAKQSLASQTAQNLPAKVGDFQLPAIFGSPAAIEIQPRFNVPYLSFAQPAAKQQWLEFVRKFPDIEDGDPVLVFPDGQMVRPSPLRMTILAATQYYAERDTNKGGIETARFLKKRTGTVERIWAALVVYLPDQAVPCTAMFKSVKCEAAQTISREIEAASKPDWVKNGQAHEMAVAAVSQPFARVVGTVSISGRTGRGSGQGYRLAKATCAPTGPAEWKLLADLTTEEGKKAFEEVANGYQSRLVDLDIK